MKKKKSNKKESNEMKNATKAKAVDGMTSPIRAGERLFERIVSFGERSFGQKNKKD